MIEQRAVQKVARRQSAIPGTQRVSAPVPETADWITGEPSVQDLLRDPLIHAILQRDGLGLQDLLQAIARGRARLAPPATASDAA